ncbi:hypothetical protein K0M31_007826, partial [Melipona bicolor]
GTAGGCCQAFVSERIAVAASLVAEQCQLGQGSRNGVLKSASAPRKVPVDTHISQPEQTREQEQKRKEKKKRRKKYSRLEI